MKPPSCRINTGLLRLVFSNTDHMMFPKIVNTKQLCLPNLKGGRGEQVQNWVGNAKVESSVSCLERNVQKSV